MRRPTRFLVSLPERLVRALAALTGGTIHETAELLLPRLVRRSRLYEATAKNLLRITVELVGGVERPRAEVADEHEPSPRRLAVRKGAGNVVELGSIFAFGFSPLWLLAAAADVTHGTRVYLDALVGELKDAGVVARDAELASVDDLLASLEGASGTTARLIDIPPLEVQALRQSLSDLRENAEGLPTPAELAAVYTGLVDEADREQRSLLEVSVGMGLAFFNSARKVGRQHVLDPYTEDLRPVRDEGFASYAARVGRPYAQAVLRHFDPRRTTLTDRGIGRLGGSKLLESEGMTHPDSFGARSRLRVGDREVEIFRVDALQERFDVLRLPYTLRILLENVLRHEDGATVTAADVEAVAAWVAAAEPSQEISFIPGRVLLQDFTGVPAVVDLAAMRDAMRDLGGDPARINPQLPAELVIDHSVQVDEFATKLAISRNAELEFERNRERYAFLRWGQGAFADFKVVPPSTGIVHQVNLEFLARVVDERSGTAFPDTLVGTDSHTTMINGLGVLGWGVGGIEAEAAMLGEAISMLVPQVVGFKLMGALPEGATATDLVLTVTQLLRETGVVGKFVEYYGHGLEGLPLADRATIGNMSPEYGATCGFFPVDGETLRYLRLTGRPEERVALVEAYCKENALWHDPDEPPTYSQVVELDLSTVEPSLAGPRRPQDRVPLREAKDAFLDSLPTFGIEYGNAQDAGVDESFPASDPPATMEPGAIKPTGEGVVPRVAAAVADSAKGVPCEIDGETFVLEHGSVVIAAITSCTNTSNPAVMVGAGLLAKKAVERGLEAEAVGEVEPGPRLEGRHRVLRQGRPDAVPRGARVPHGRVRLHDVHRELRPAPGADLAGDRRGRPRRLCGPLRQPELRGADPRRGEGELPRLPAARRRLRPGRAHGPRSRHRADRGRLGRRGRVPLGPLALAGGGARDGRQLDRRGDVPRDVRRRLHRRRDVARAPGARGRALRLGSGLDVRAPPALLRRDATGAGRGRGRRRRSLPRVGRRLGDDRPHLAGGCDRARLAGRALPRRARRRAEGVQLVRLAPREPRGHGARHVRERPAAEPARPRAPRGRGPSISPPARRGRSSTPPSATAPRERR